MTITATQTKSEFCRNTLRIFYAGGSGKLLLLLGLGFIVYYLIQLVMMLNGGEVPQLYSLVAGIGILTLLPALIYRKASMVYDNNPAVNQPITYTFTEEGVGTKGGGFDSTMTWDKILRVYEQKEAILLFYTKQIANPIPKRNFTEIELVNFRNLVNNVPGLSADMGE